MLKLVLNMRRKMNKQAKDEEQLIKLFKGKK